MNSWHVNSKAKLITLNTWLTRIIDSHEVLELLESWIFFLVIFFHYQSGMVFSFILRKVFLSQKNEVQPSVQNTPAASPKIFHFLLMFLHKIEVGQSLSGCVSSL